MNRAHIALQCCCAALLVLAPPAARAQGKASPGPTARGDTTAIRVLGRHLPGRDSTAVRDTSRTDTAKTASGIDSVVTYTASDTVVYNHGARTKTLYGKGDIR